MPILRALNTLGRGINDAAPDVVPDLPATIVQHFGRLTFRSYFSQILAIIICAAAFGFEKGFSKLLVLQLVVTVYFKELYITDDGVPGRM